MSGIKKLYLTTGFLGSGKTTLVKNLIGFFAGHKLAVIVNEFSETGVDGAALSGRGADVLEISGGSAFCVCRSDLFADELARALKSDSDIVIVETSGLSDPTGMNRILDAVKTLSASDTAFDFRGVIAVVDAARFNRVVDTLAAVRQQILSAGLILLNKTDLVSSESVESVIKAISAINPFAYIHSTAYSALPVGWEAVLDRSQRNIEGGISVNTIGVSKFTLRVPEGAGEGGLNAWLHRYSPLCYRIKGFVELSGSFFFADCAGISVSLTKLGSLPEGAKSGMLAVISPTDKLKKEMADSLAGLV